MTNPKKAPAPAAESDREIVITRLIDAPRELVWQAMTDPRQVVKWWGPNGFSTTIEKMDFRVGGTWQHVMRGPDGVNYPNKSVFTEIVENERICYAHSGGREGAPESEHICKQFTWTFEDIDGKTRLTIRMVFDTAEARDTVVKTYNAIEGGNQTLGRLAEYMAAVPVFTLSRTLDAPRALVYAAFTDPERMKHWWGPKGFTVIASKMDLKVGGTYHYGMTSPQGQEMWGKFTYREITPPARLVLVNSFSDKDGGVTRHPFNAGWPLELLSIFTFEERQGKTVFTIRWSPLNATPEEVKTFADGLPSMNQGWGGTLEQLAAYLKTAT